MLGAITGLIGAGSSLVSATKAGGSSGYGFPGDTISNNQVIVPQMESVAQLIKSINTPSHTGGYPIQVSKSGPIYTYPTVQNDYMLAYVGIGIAILSLILFKK